jgi:CRISPR system Cascade subunit CasD
MNSYLIFRLFGVMSAWGEIAPAATRLTTNHPTKSGVLGMVSAALGLPRNEIINDSYNFAVLVHNSGTPMRDFHTIHIPTHDSTIISTRDYHCGAMYSIALSIKDDAPYSLEEIKSALEEPVFTLFLGRKSCPLALPMEPKIIEAGDVEEAFNNCEFIGASFVQTPRATALYWDEPTHVGMILLTRRDKLVNSERRQFTERQEAYKCL